MTTTVAFDVDDEVMRAASARAADEQSTLDAELRRRLTEYSDRERRMADLEGLLVELTRRFDTSGPKPNAEERNAR